MELHIYLYDEWRKWLRENDSLGEGTINSYSDTYLPNLFKRLRQQEPSINDIVRSLLASDNPWDAIDLLYRLLGAWKAQDPQVFVTGRPPLSQKTISNYASALASYIDFLIDLITSGTLTTLIKPLTAAKHVKWSLTRNVTQLHYTRDDLERTFIARIGTQDRFPTVGVYFPIRLIKKIIRSQHGGGNWLKTWFTRYVRGIRVLAQKEIYRVGELDSLDIYGTAVYVNNKADRVLTETASVGRPNPDKMQAKTLAGISINHDVPISIMLAAGGWQALDQLTQMVNTWYKSQHPHANAIAQGVFAVFQKLSATQQQKLIDGLKEDLKRIAISPLTLMERDENSKKNNKLTVSNIQLS